MHSGFDDIEKFFGRLFRIRRENTCGMAVCGGRVGRREVAGAECDQRCDTPDDRHQQAESPRPGPGLDFRCAPTGGIDITSPGGVQTVVGDELVAEQFVVVGFGEFESTSDRLLSLLPVAGRELIEQ